MSSLLYTRCKFCGQTMVRLAITAMLQDAGCSSSIDAIECHANPDGGAHSFDAPDEKQNEEQEAA